MCRHLSYLGAPITLAELLVDPPHALLRQSWAPRDMRGGGTINADGFGVGWYAEDPDVPIRYRRSSPMWTDTTFTEFARVTRSTAVFAAVRSATAGLPVSEAATAPFASGPWLFSHNGVVRGWPQSVAKLAESLPIVDLLTLDAPTDTALLWALVRHRLHGGGQPAEVLRSVVADVSAAAPESRLNLLLSDGRSTFATTVGHALSVRHTDDSVVVASEPFDTAGDWTAVPDHHLVVADPTTYYVEPL
jgi:gamma-glutamyl hercynylcysteine S-oxide hydrolase